MSPSGPGSDLTFALVSSTAVTMAPDISPEPGIDLTFALVGSSAVDMDSRADDGSAAAPGNAHSPVEECQILAVQSAGAVTTEELSGKNAAERKSLAEPHTHANQEDIVSGPYHRGAQQRPLPSPRWEAGALGPPLPEHTSNHLLKLAVQLANNTVQQ